MLCAAALTVELGGRRVLSEVTLEMTPGDVVAVLGPNGAGKSTLLKALAGIAPPAAGTVSLVGRDLATLSPREIGRRIAYLPQDRVAHWPMPVSSVVALGRRPHGGLIDRLTPADATAIDRALTEMDVAHLAERPVTALSGGERARVLIARALAQEAEVLLADEPLAGLDPAHQLQLAACLTGLARSGRTVVTAMHDLALAMRIATRVVLLGDGRVHASGPARDCLTPETIAEVFGVRARIETIDGLTIVIPLSVLQ